MGQKYHLWDIWLQMKGSKPDPAKIDAVAKMTKPTDAKSIQRFIGFVTYLSLFLPDHSNETISW
jgi:hypothetical protein